MPVLEVLLWCTCQLSMSLCLNSKQQQQQGAKPGTGQFAQSLANLRPGTGQSAQSLVYLGPGTGQSAQSLSDLGPGTGQFAQSLANLGPGTGQFAQSLVSVDFARLSLKWFWLVICSYIFLSSRALCLCLQPSREPGSPSSQCLEALSKVQVRGVHLHHLHPRCLDWDLELEDPADDSYPDQELDQELEG